MGTTSSSASPTQVASVEPGQAVRVACLERGWARLTDPHEGNYVYSRGLILDGDPAAC